MMASSAYSLSFFDDFPCAVEPLFDLMTDLTRFHLWNTNTLAITEAPRMHKGLAYTAQTVTAGQLSKSRVQVTDLIPNQEIHLTNNAGAVSYDALLLFEPTGHDRTRVTCKMRFTLSSGLIDAARPVIETMAETRIRSNWQILRALLPGGGH